MRAFWMAGVGCMGLLVAACGSSPASPGGGQEGSPRSSLAGLAGVELEGPASVGIGETTTFALTGHFADGARRNVAAEASWSTSDGSVIAVASPGNLRGVAAGEAVVSAFITSPTGPRSFSSRRELIAVPGGTYRLVGRVTEADHMATPVAGARVEAASAGRPALVTTTLDDGLFRFYGLVGDTQLRVSSEGYETLDRTLVISDHTIRNFDIRLSAPRLEASGTYRVTITASSSCSAALPEDARSRTYLAVLTQNGARVDAALSAEELLNGSGEGNRLTGRVTPAGLTLTLDAYDNYGWYLSSHADVIERLDGGYLTIDGNVTMTPSGQDFRGTLNGAFRIFQQDPRTGAFRQSPTSWCRALDHRFVLART